MVVEFELMVLIIIDNTYIRYLFSPSCISRYLVKNSQSCLELQLQLNKKIPGLKLIGTAMEKLVTRLRSKSSEALPALYEGNTLPLPEIREYLAQFKGGSVNLLLGDDGIATITLNHPEKRNAISGKMMGDLLDVVEKLEGWKEGKGVILRGQGGNFCSGGDLDMARGTGTADGGFRMFEFMNSVLSRLQSLPFITVAFIQGCGALGGGSEVSLACDYRLITPNCRGIGFVHGKMGIIPAWGGSGRLVQVVGYRKALSLLSTAKVYCPQDLLDIGLVDEIAPSEENAESFVREWLGQRTTLSPSLIHALKTTALLTRPRNPSEQLEQQIFAPLWGGPENKAALAANIKHTPR